MRFWNTFFLLLGALVFVTFQSKVYVLGLVAGLLLVFIARNLKKNKVILYRKLPVYLAILPFSLWWFLSPSVESGISPWIFFIPSLYLFFLALVQWRSLGRGGAFVFIRFNALAAVLLSIRDPDWFSGVLLVFFFLTLLFHIRPSTPFWRWFMAIVLSVLGLFALIFSVSFLQKKTAKSWNKNWGDDYYWSRHMMGFDPVASLGSFTKNYESKYDHQIVLRLWTQEPPVFLKAVAYERFLQGLWKSSDKDSVLQAMDYFADYALFQKDSSSISNKVWVQSDIKTFQYLFAPANAVGVGLKSDSIRSFVGGHLQNIASEVKDWYYLEADEILDSLNALDFLSWSLSDSLLLQVASLEMGLDASMSPSQLAIQIQKYFSMNFEYSLVVNAKKKSEALWQFWDSKKGYCEYFATLAVLLMRYHGVPARYVVGFAYPEFSADRSYSFFRRKHSHAWVEFFEGHWKSTDPTPLRLQEENPQSWLALKQEAFKAKWNYYLHALKEGSWRQSLDSWQVFVESLLARFETYAVLFLLFLCYVFYKRKKKKSAFDAVHFKQEEWALTLNNALKTLSKLGYSLETGETIGFFILRLESLEEVPVARPWKRALKSLKDYQTHRWCP